jgi:hypothetical protein
MPPDDREQRRPFLPSIDAYLSRRLHTGMPLDLIGRR